MSCSRRQVVHSKAHICVTAGFDFWVTVSTFVQYAERQIGQMDPPHRRTLDWTHFHFICWHWMSIGCGMVCDYTHNSSIGYTFSVKCTREYGTFPFMPHHLPWWALFLRPFWHSIYKVSSRDTLSELYWVCCISFQVSSTMMVQVKDEIPFHILDFMVSCFILFTDVQHVSIVVLAQSLPRWCVVAQMAKRVCAMHVGSSGKTRLVPR